MKKSKQNYLEELMTVQKVANHLGIPVRTVLWQVSNGVIPGARKIGVGKRGIWVIPPDALRKYVRPTKGRPAKKTKGQK